MRLLIPILFFLPSLALSQILQPNEKEKDPYKSTIEKNIFRAFLSASTDTKYSLTGSYEREISKPITIVFKGGPAYNKSYDSTDVFGKRQYKWIFNLIGSAEIRYYYNLHRRSRLKKTTKNFSGYYLSIEQLLSSKPIFILNATGDESINSYHSTYFNIGYQYQFKKTYYNIFAGSKVTGNRNTDAVENFDNIHAGVSIGRVF